MAEQEQKKKGSGTRSTETEAEVEEAAPASSERGEKIKADLDDLLDEIDEGLEDNAEEFVRNYVQKGGQYPPVALPLFPPERDPGPDFVGLLRMTSGQADTP